MKCIIKLYNDRARPAKNKQYNICEKDITDIHIHSTNIDEIYILKFCLKSITSVKSSV